MARSSSSPTARLPLPLLVLLLCLSSLSMAAAQKYNAVYSFGDSITDTGNLCTNGRPSAITFTQPPYGETYFGSPTCRCSDGRVIVDFLSTKYGLPFLPPSKSTSADFKKGANMAITGATAMDAPFFRSLGLSDKIWNNGPISFQLQWFQTITSSVCGSSCKSYLANSLFIFGEFGGNDYNAMLFGNYNTDQASTYAPQIVDTIGAGVEKLVAMGAVDVVVPGVLPIGCFPIYLTIYGTSSAADYDALGCLKKFNDLSTYHNSLLQAKVTSLQAKYKSARIMYADFYAGVYDMVRSPSKYGFSSVFEACCGSGGGKYNYANSARCGMSGASACASPASHLSWDGIHLTEAAYKQITDGWLNGAFCHPGISH
ncbi:GDSL esterase/lipase At5g45910-like [Triticum urartu]|uniref:GDSL esterase/lipase n=1 Tax=Triticum urartu TaxID=4572 RepID=A0A8R7QZR4_TRIUA|nr:GDSL esterase/lipase At5g45910-like [Triticum dicoccoides]XP_048541577.1 GDSL esterase/lipase At5g45910-like [Triticum urartu]